MTEALEMDCALIHKMIDRLAGLDALTDDETAQMILHNRDCQECTQYLAETFRRDPEGEPNSDNR